MPQRLASAAPPGLSACLVPAVVSTKGDVFTQTRAPAHL